MPEWAPGLGSSIERIDGQWIMESPMGRIVLDFAPKNDYGVLDHSVTPGPARLSTTRCE